MRIPQKKIEDWVDDRIEECSISRATRANNGRFWNDYYYNGSDNEPAVYNRCYSHIDRMASFLYSPADVRFNIEFDVTMGREYLDRAEVASRYLSREFHRAAVDLTFGGGVETALVKGASILKQNWGSYGLDPYIIQPEAFGVLREDVTDLDRQEAFVHTTFLTLPQMWRLLYDHPDCEDIFKKIQKTASKNKDISNLDGSFMQQIVMGGIQPIGTSGTSTGRGSVASQSNPTVMMAPDVLQSLVRLDELWAWDDETEDYTTIQRVDPKIIIEGKYKRRNLCGVKGENPFTKICPNEVDGYFWGRSELAPVRLIQEMLNDRIDEYDRMSALRAQPPHIYSGFNGITDEINTMLQSPGGYITESTPNAKAEAMAPSMPQDVFAGINEICGWFDDVAGFESIMKGQGEAGVRAGVHADTLMRSAGNRIRDRALLIERQVGNAGDFTFKLLQDKEAKVFVTKAPNLMQRIMGKEQPGQEFLLKQMPEDYRVQVDSHSASPAFSQDAKQMAYELAKLGAIDAASIIDLVHPPMADILKQRAQEKAEAQAKFLAEHPEAATKGKSHKK